MRRIAAALLLSLTLCLGVSGCCSKPAPLVVTPALELPTRPEMLHVTWMHTEDGLHCLDDSEAKKLLINDGRMKTHIEVLEGYINSSSGK